jgi:outer membrane protein OmpA-like peptidoglycan-associated protein
VSRRASLVLVLAAAHLGSCATGESLRRERETIEDRLEAARESGAYDCAPRELAMAETHLEFLGVELEEGDSRRASYHRDKARDALATVMERTRGCKPVVAVAKISDRDGDGVPDDNDACPTVPGPPELLGCPDSDGDRIPDYLDKCPYAPGDPPDGCPKVKDRDGDGVPDVDDACPDDPGPKENKGCPIKDRDHDGVLDVDDLCPDEPGPKENKGCPCSHDRDGDGIPDCQDKCPDLPETYNGFQDEDGCPDINPNLVKVNREIGKIEIKQKVFFDTGKWVIKPVSFKLLNEVAEALKQNAGMEVMVEGHTDSVGGDTFNLTLSQNRAESVREYLVGQGVDPGRLKARGYGKTMPLDTNSTAAGRERNRRVEFTITRDPGQPGGGTVQ